ncbi:radical SAM family heme chaperone HemW [Thiohalobacter sp. IOR34]|uniref:radical SAM family heme chaperone HemW n=1 Tax=Thiohalobacter sp. IOR34 TaxID=3057176 RepID=UPI0025B05086|nr:radical SAM family heme chaperone HemW [Thiohalobacter sp. IOR34]WJW75698.1 radical SAM family heme chaperone HemW [Thiohalobacter sp. IOR34]
MLSLYVHIPWCLRKCPYCDFNSHELRGEIPADTYVAALLADLEQELPAVWGRTVETVFIGGGTPSLLPAEAVDRLLSGIRSRLSLRPDAEITLEANPGALERGRFAEYRAAGVSRLSIGVQSFDDAQLARIGRIHDRGQALQAVDEARAAGFERINLDLMFGQPGQTQNAALADLDTALALQPGHLSWYQFTLEPNTWFHRHPPALPGDDLIAAIQDAGQARLAEAGYARYEVSAWARPGHGCQHNLNYWRFGDYLGIGAGAHGKLTDAASGQIRRYAKQRHPRRYLQTAATPQRIASEQILGETDILFEYLLNALRLESGFRREDFRAATGLPVEPLESALQRPAEKGLLETGEWIRPTPRGRRFLDDLLADLLPD